MGTGSVKMLCLFQVLGIITAPLYTKTLEHTHANTHNNNGSLQLLILTVTTVDTNPDWRLRLWHPAAPRPGRERLYVSICGEHLWQMGDTLKSHRPLHFPQDQLPGTTNHCSAHVSSFPFSLPSPQAPAAAGDRFNTTHRCKWQNHQAHEKEKK